MMYNALQLVLVVTPDWGAVQGHLYRFQRESLKNFFEIVGKSIPVVVGQQGMAWGIGLHTGVNEMDLKREGDRKAPAGIFNLGPIFIDSRFPLLDFNIPSIKIDQYWEAVDDPVSSYYNQLVDVRSVLLKDWSSSEIMQRDDELYHLGLVIYHNPLPSIPNKGSCIFMHNWRTNEQGTYGCTAMASWDLQQVLRWLNPEMAPLLVQLPLNEYLARKGEWQLPDID